jgi:hypothetical protein
MRRFFPSDYIHQWSDPNAWLPGVRIGSRARTVTGSAARQQHLWDQERRDRADAAVGTDDRRPADHRTLTRFFSDQNDFVTNMIGRTF